MASRRAQQHIPESVSDTSKRRRSHWSRLRLTVLFAAFLLILINPLLNYYLHIDVIQGWYQSFGLGSLWFVSPLEGLESLLITKSFYMPALVGMLIPVIIALLLGRVFCSWVCPINFILELTDRVRRFIARKRYVQNRLVIAKKVLWFTLIAELLLSMILGAPLFVFLSPPGLVGREIMMLVFFKTLALEGVLLLVVLGLELVTRRFYCRSFCPLGALLALIGSNRRLKISFEKENCTTCGLCDRSCPMGIQPSSGEGAGPYCWNCGECLDNCHHDALHFVWRSSK
jgi:ferredoxin-type protein NapH